MFGQNPMSGFRVEVVKKIVDARTDGQTDGRTDGSTDDGRRTMGHHKSSP